MCLLHGITHTNCKLGIVIDQNMDSIIIQLETNRNITTFGDTVTVRYFFSIFTKTFLLILKNLLTKNIQIKNQLTGTVCAFEYRHENLRMMLETIGENCKHVENLVIQMCYTAIAKT